MNQRFPFRSILLALAPLSMGVAHAQETWTKVPTKISPEVRLNAVTWAGTQFAAGGLQGAFSRSSDGIQWKTTIPTTRTGDSIVGLCWTGTRIVLLAAPVVPYSYDQVLASTDGETWRSTFLKATGFSTVRWTGGRTVVLTSSGGMFVSGFSADSALSLEWFLSYGSSLRMRAIASTASRRIIVGDSGQAITTDQDSGWVQLSWYDPRMYWTRGSTGTTRNLLDLVSTGSQFLVVGENGTILTTTDGLSWTARISGTTTALRSVVWTGERFVVVGDSGTILTSPDGVSWTRQTSPTMANLRGVAWSGSRFVAVGDSGTILTSTPSETSVERKASSSIRSMSARMSSGRLVLELPADLRRVPISIRLRDVHGRAVWSSTTVANETIEANVPSLSNGLYQVVVDGAGRRTSLMVRWLP